MNSCEKAFKKIDYATECMFKVRAIRRRNYWMKRVNDLSQRALFRQRLTFSR